MTKKKSTGQSSDKAKIVKAVKWVLAIVIAAIIAAIITAIIREYLEPDGKPSTTPQVSYIGRVINNNTEDPIRGAKVSLEFEGAPPIVYTDSEGIFRFLISLAGSSLAGRVKVEATGYGDYDRNITLLSNNPNIEDIRLNPSHPPKKELSSLINKTIATYPDKENVAMIIESSKTEHGISPENLLYNLLKTEKVNIIINFFEEKAFKSKGFFGEIYDGNTDLLKEADVFSKIDYIILGKIDYLFRETGLIDKDLISCDVTFSYKVINKNAQVVESNSISVTGSGFSENKALEQGLKRLCEEYSDRIMKSIL